MNEQFFCASALSCRKLLYHVAYTLLRDNQACEDAVQEALCKAWKKRGSLRDESSFKYWLVRILTNTCHDMLSKRRHAARLPLPQEETAKASSEDQILKNRALHDALGMLPETLRLPTILHYLEGFSLAEIARMEKCPEGTIRNRLFRARQQLKALLGEEMTL